MKKKSSSTLNLINKFEINLHDDKKNNELYKALRQLVTILFAVVLGVGLSQLEPFIHTSFWDANAFALYIAYLAVLLSWYGYHFGVIEGPAETNLLNYIIDCFLLITYWLLINDRTPFSDELVWLATMFILYITWESIRCFQENTNSYKEQIKKAILVNAIFALIILVAWLLFKETDIWWHIVLIGIILVYYRIIIYRVYLPPYKTKSLESDNENEIETILINKAKAIATNALINISQFPVGAAIRSSNGKIYVGCNIEFDNLSNTIHAEESAICSMITDGEKCPTHIAVYTSSDTLWFPCGLCRQSLFELGGNDLKVIACNDNKHKVKKIGEILPEGFRL